MGGGHGKRRSGFLTRIGRFFSARKRNAYLEQYGYYDSFDARRLAHSPGAYPYLPYSLQDMLNAKRITGKNVLVASHYSTALWFAGGRNTVTLARELRDGKGSSRLRYVGSWREYSGPPVDIMVWDSHAMPSDWGTFADRVLSPRGVVIFVYSQYFDALESGLGALCEYLVKAGMRSLEFRNPGPRRELMTAELYYPRDNVLDI